MIPQLYDGMPQPHTLPTLDTLVAHKENLQIVFLSVVTKSTDENTYHY